MTNRDIVTAALRMLGVLDANETASFEDASLGLGELNDLMSSLSADGIDLGFPPQDSLQDDWPLSDEIGGQVKSMLALQLSAYYPSAMSPALALRADRARSSLARDAVLENREEATTAIPLGSAYSDYDIETGS